MAFIEHRVADDPTNWWAPNHAGVQALLRSAGFTGIQRIAHEVYVCEADQNLSGFAVDELNTIFPQRTEN